MRPDCPSADLPKAADSILEPEVLFQSDVPEFELLNMSKDESWKVGLASLAATIETLKNDLTKDLKKEMDDQKDINKELKAELAKIREQVGINKQQVGINKEELANAPVPVAGAVEEADQIIEGCNDPNKIESVVCTQEKLTQIEITNGEEHCLNPSAWDACAFIGFGVLGKQDAFFAMLSSCMNFVLQLMFCLVTYTNMTSPPIDEETVKAVKHWRGVFGHDYAYADHNGNHVMSLAAQLCGKDPGMVQSASQMELYSAIMDYLQPEDTTLQSLDGRVMCVIATFCWCLLLLEDVRDNCGLQNALYHQEEGTPEIKVCEDGTYEITRFSRAQKVLFFV